MSHGIETVDNIFPPDSSRTAGTYNVSSFTAQGRGTGAVFTVTVNGSGEASVSVASAGNNYVIDETIIVADSQLGNGGAVSLQFDVNEVS